MDFDQINRNRTKAKRDQMARTISDEVAYANAIQEETGCSRDEALRVAYERARKDSMED